jgi:predicted nucleic acid-binding protein
VNDFAPFGGGVFIADKSAWGRAQNEAVREEWAAAVLNDQIATCAVVKLELLHSARTSAEYEKIEETLDALRDIPITTGVCSAALGGMREMAARSDGYHRKSLPDYLIAAAAQESALGVLHYDHHFDDLQEVFNFESRWIADRGTLD